MWILFSLLISSSHCVQYNDINNQFIGKWISQDDSCRQVLFKINGVFDQKESCKSLKLLDEDNKCKIYEIDTILNKYTLIIKTFSKNKLCSQRFHILIDFPVLILTPLKSLSGLETHYTEPEVFVHNNSYNNYCVPYFPLSYIYIPCEIKSEFIYIAYKQENGQNEQIDSQGNNIFNIPNNGMLKTKSELDTRFLAFNNFKAIYYDEIEEKELPILTHKEYLNYRINLTHFQRQAFLDRKKITSNSKVLVALRYNPDRESVVNKVFKEQIYGQVQSFMLVHSLKITN